MTIAGLLVLAISYPIFLLLLAGWLTRSAAKRGLRRWPRVLGVIVLFSLIPYSLLFSQEMGWSSLSSEVTFVLSYMSLLIILALYLKGIIIPLCLGIWFYIYIKDKASSDPESDPAPDSSSNKRTLGSFLVFCAGLALLNANEIYAYYEFKKICRRDGGTHIYKKVEVNGFYYDVIGSKYAYKKFLGAGYEYVEGRLWDESTKNTPSHSQVYRFSLDKKGNLTYVPISHPVSQYGVPFVGSKGQITDYIEENQSHRIDDLKTKETIAINRSFTIQDATTGSSKHCGFTENLPGTPIGFEMILSALPPINRRNTP